MLAALLPGLREFRTPLAVGYAWLIALWLAVGYRAPRADAAHGFLADVYRLAHTAGPVAVGVAVSVGAYLLGVTATRLGLGITYALGDLLRRTPVGPATPGARRVNRLANALTLTVVTRLAERIVDDEGFRARMLDHVPHDDDASRGVYESHLLRNYWARDAHIRKNLDVNEMAGELGTELWDIAARLRGAGDVTALEYDRLVSEADFRIAMFGPLAALCLVAAIRWNPLCLVAALPLVTLLYAGVAARAEADEELAQALASGRITDPAVDRLAAVALNYVAVTQAETESPPPAVATEPGAGAAVPNLPAAPSPPS